MTERTVDTLPGYCGRQFVMMLQRREGPGYAIGEVDRSRLVSVKGVVSEVRQISKNLTFIDIQHTIIVHDTSDEGELSNSGNASDSSNHGADTALQVVINRKICTSAGDLNTCSYLQKRDTIRVSGHPGRTRSGQEQDVSLFATTICVESFELSDPSRVIALIGDAVHRRTDTEKIRCQMGLSKSLFESMQVLLHKPMQRREASILRSREADERKLLAPSGAPHNKVSSGGCSVDSLKQRRSRLDEVAKRRYRDFYIVLEAPSKISNVAAIMRTCDALGVTKLLLVSPDAHLTQNVSSYSINEKDAHCVKDTGDGSSSSSSDGDSGGDSSSSSGSISVQSSRLFCSEILRRCSASANFWVETEVFQSVSACASYLNANPRLVVSYGTVLNTQSKTLWETVFLSEVQEKGFSRLSGVALWFGTEVHGLSEEAVAYCKHHVYVPMNGMVESLNLSVCLGIVAAEVVRQHKQYENNQKAGAHTSHAHYLTVEEQGAWVGRMESRATKRRKAIRYNKHW